MMFILIVLVRPHREGRSGPLPPSCLDSAEKAGSERLHGEPEGRARAPLPQGGECQGRARERANTDSLGSDTRSVPL